MASSAKPVPEGHHTITPHLVVRNASEAIEFYKKALGAEEMYRIPGPDGRLMHAALQIGDSKLFLVDEFPEFGSSSPKTIGGSPVTIHLFVEDVDSTFNRAVEAGATVAMPLQNMFWGDRYGSLVDPFGHNWSIATHLEDLTPKQMKERTATAFAGQPCSE
jgi:PhnB protein